jgi:hypothetical protein
LPRKADRSGGWGEQRPEEFHLTSKSPGEGTQYLQGNQERWYRRGDGVGLQFEGRIVEVRGR